MRSHFHLERRRQSVPPPSRGAQLHRGVGASEGNSGLVWARRGKRRQGKGSSWGQSRFPQGWSSAAQGLGSSQGSDSSRWEKGGLLGAQARAVRLLGGVTPMKAQAVASLLGGVTPAKGRAIGEAIDEARNLAVDNYQNARVSAIEEHGLPVVAGSCV